MSVVYKAATSLEPSYHFGIQNLIASYQHIDFEFTELYTNWT